MYKVKFIKTKSFLFIIFVLGIVIIPFISFAESQIEIQEGEISISTSPSNPQPYQNVTITLSSYATDLSKAVITWQSGSNTILSGIGKTSYSFTTGGPNTFNIFDINIVPVGSLNSIGKRVVITPSEIEIMWESIDGYVPPFYKGKALPTSGSMIRAVAIPNTNTIKSGQGSISYTWKNDGSTKLDASGYNKNSYTFKNSMFDSKNTITVTASSVAGNYNAENTIDIPVYDPKIIFYKKSPTEGVLYNKALDKEITLLEDEITIVAEPYFTSLNGNEDKFTYKWQINGNSIATPSKKTELTVRPSSRGGYATIGLVIENLSELFQKVSNQLRLNL